MNIFLCYPRHLGRVIDQGLVNFLEVHWILLVTEGIRSLKAPDPRSYNPVRRQDYHWGDTAKNQQDTQRNLWHRDEEGMKCLRNVGKMIFAKGKNKHEVDCVWEGEAWRVEEFRVKFKFNDYRYSRVLNGEGKW